MTNNNNNNKTGLWTNEHIEENWVTTGSVADQYPLWYLQQVMTSVMSVE